MSVHRVGLATVGTLRMTLVTEDLVKRFVFSVVHQTSRAVP